MCVGDIYLTLNKTYLYHLDCINNLYKTCIYHQLHQPHRQGHWGCVRIIFMGCVTDWVLMRVNHCNDAHNASLTCTFNMIAYHVSIGVGGCWVEFDFFTVKVRRLYAKNVDVVKRISHGNNHRCYTIRYSLCSDLFIC